MSCVILNLNKSNSIFFYEIGKWDDLWKVQRQSLPASELVMKPERQLTSLPSLYQNEFVFVDSHDKFDEMITQIKSVKEISLDLEANDDHSYLGI